MYVCIQCHSPLSVYISYWGLLYWVNCLWVFVYELSEVFLPLCLSYYVLYVWKTSELFLGTLDFCLFHHYIHWWFDCFPWLDLSISMLIHFFLWSICFSHGNSFVLPTLFFIHVDLHFVFDIFLFFSFIIDIVILDSFFFIDILILDVLKNMVHEIFCTYCILYTRVWDFIIRIIELSFSSFIHLITLAYVTSQVLRPPQGHDIMHCVLITLT